MSFVDAFVGFLVWCFGIAVFVFKAYVLTVLLNWFLVPKFPSLELEIPYAIGIFLILYLLFAQLKGNDFVDGLEKLFSVNPKDIADELETSFKDSSASLFVTLCLLLAGWITQFWL